MRFKRSNLHKYVKKGTESIQKGIQLLKEKNILKSMRISYKIIWNLLLILLIFIGTVFFFIGGAGAGYFVSLVKDEPILSYQEMKAKINDYTETSNIYLAGHVYLGKIPASLEREEVNLDQISEYVKEAIIATEDRYFYQHNGVVPKAVFRALLQQMTNSGAQTGGSTLTQQLVKTQILTPEVSFKRKAKEMLDAMRIEHFFSKSQILRAYLNVVPFGRNAAGNNIAGIQAAAQGVFGVDADQLNLPQAAFLAGIPQNPFTYTPFLNSGGVKKDISFGLKRMKTVLHRMKNSHFITEKQYEKALDYNIRKHLSKQIETTYEKYPYLTTEIKRRAETILAKKMADNNGENGEKLAKNAQLYEKHLFEKNHPRLGTIDPDLKRDATQLKKDSEKFHRYLEIANKRISSDGYQIYTTINKKIYDTMQKVVHEYKNYGPRRPFCYNGKCDVNKKTGEEKEYIQQVASMLIKNDTGAILGFIPGRNHEELEYNLATQALRSNGSTMKPILVYAPAMEMGIVQPGSTVADFPFNYTNGKGVHNFNKSAYHGLESVRQALYLSHNVPAVKTFTKELKQGEPRTFLEKMGITSLVGAGDNQALGIGALSRGITVEENTNAYTTFANNGKFIDAYMIQKIVDAKGHVVYEHPTDPVKIFSPQTNYLMLDMMRDVLTKGTATRVSANLRFHPDWAGKTGTSNGVTDEWFVATNPNVTLGIWTGYAKQISMPYSPAAHRTQDLWVNVANALYNINPKLMNPEERFHMPADVVKRTVCDISGILPSDLCKKTGLVRSDLFNVKYAPDQPGDALRGEGRYVVINGKQYLAHKNTPKELTDEGPLLNEAFMEKHFLQFNMKDFRKYTKFYKEGAWKDLTIARKLKEDGKPPSAVREVQFSEGKLTWRANPEEDVIGYRVYTAPKGRDMFTKIADIKVENKKGEALAYTIPSGNASDLQFKIAAVDIDGKESTHSHVITPANKHQPARSTEKSQDNLKKNNPQSAENGDSKEKTISRSKAKHEQPKNPD